jgi:hypothetical protein
MLFLKDLDYEDIVVFDTKMVILKKIHLCFTQRITQYFIK